MLRSFGIWKLRREAGGVRSDLYIYTCGPLEEGHEETRCMGGNWYDSTGDILVCSIPTGVTVTSKETHTSPSGMARWNEGAGMLSGKECGVKRNENDTLSH